MTRNLTAQLEHDIISAARRFGVRKVKRSALSACTFTARSASNISSRRFPRLLRKFAETLHEEIDTLLPFDVVNLDDNLAVDFLAEIERDAVILYEEVPPAVKKIDAFVNVINRLAKASELKLPYSDLELAGIIRLFENSFELAWKALREILLIHGVSTAASGSPREILKAGYQYHFIDDAELWLDMPSGAT